MTSFAKACIDFSNNLKNLRFTKSNIPSTSSTVTVTTTSPTTTNSSVVLKFESGKVKTSVTNEYIISITNGTTVSDSKANNQHFTTVSTDDKQRFKKCLKNNEPTKCKSTHCTSDKSTTYNKFFPLPINITTSNHCSANNTNDISSANHNIKISNEKEDPPTLRKSVDTKPTQLSSQENSTIYPGMIALAQNRKNIISNESVHSDFIKSAVSNSSDNRSSNSKIPNSLPNSPLPKHTFVTRNKFSSELSDDNNIINQKSVHNNTHNLTNTPFTFKSTLSPTMTHRLTILARNYQNSIINNDNKSSFNGNDSSDFLYNRYSNNSTSSSSSPVPLHRGSTVAAIKQRLLSQGLRINLNIPAKKTSSTRYRDYVRRQKRGCPHTVESLWLNKNLMNNIFGYLTGAELIHASTVCRIWYEFMCLDGFQNKLCFVLNMRMLLREIENNYEVAKLNRCTDYKEATIDLNYDNYIPIPDDLLYRYLEDSIRVRIVSAVNRHLETIKIVQLIERFSSVLYNILEMLLNSTHSVVSTSLLQSSNLESCYPQANTRVVNTSTKNQTSDNQNLWASSENHSQWMNITGENNHSVYKTNGFLDLFHDSVKQQQQNNFIQENISVTTNDAIQNDPSLSSNSLSTLNETYILKKLNDSKISISSYLSNSENANSAYTHKFTHIIFKSCSILDQSISRFINLFPSVKQLEFECCNDFTELAFWSCLLPSIEHLTVFDCINVSDESMNAIGNLLPELKYLKFQAYHITDTALSYFSAKQRTNMHTMELIQCMDVTNQGIMTLAYTLNNLQILSLSGCSKLTDDGLDVICENLKCLLSLNLSWCSKITDSGLECIACDLILLKKLLLDRCTELTDLGISYLATMSSLQHLSVRWCVNLSDGSIPHLLSTTGLNYLCLSGK
ncbi:F-box/LRR-repeat protein 16 [Schistosoma japonicum]|nr:F-box/LRR-repeat protein 16 [Schistosoma japonicum]